MNKVFCKRHYYRTGDLSQLENPFCLGFPTGNARTKGGALLSRVWQPGQKAIFCPGCCTLLSRLVLPTGTKGPFFPIFLFSILFLFQLYFCISIKLMYSNSVCMISTNIYIYIYIYSYLKNSFLHPLVATPTCVSHDT